MNLTDATRKTGCAIFTDGHCTTSVERLTDEEYLLMTRRGVSILQCLHLPKEQIEERYPETEWLPGAVHFQLYAYYSLYSGWI